MVALNVIVESEAEPRASLALDRALAGSAREQRTSSVHVYGWTGDVLLLGRFHARPARVEGVWRRRSGGRAVAAGAGFVGLSLVLPHRSALVSDDPAALRPEQVLNRAVRGLLGGLELLGIDAVYPGRDLVTVGGKPIGWLSLVVEADGATVVEAGLAVDRDLSLLPGLADRLDSEGVVPVTCWSPDAVTSVARERRAPAPAMGEVADALVEGFRRRLGCTITATAPPLVRAAAGGDDDESGVADGPGCGRASVMLGTLLAVAGLGADGAVARLRLGGDVIAPVATLRTIERALVGVPPVRALLAARVAGVLAEPDHFLLGATGDDVAGAVLSGVSR